MNPNLEKNPVAYVHPSRYVDYKLNPDFPTGQRCVEMLKNAGYNASGNDKFNWIHDVHLISIHMLPKACPPTTLISLNARYDPHYHMKVGSTVRELRKENYLLIGTGGAVHTGTDWSQCFASRTISLKICLRSHGHWSSGRPWRMQSTIIQDHDSGGPNEIKEESGIQRRSCSGWSFHDCHVRCRCSE